MEQLKAFLEKAGADSELTVKLEALNESANVSEQLIAIAAEFGFTITAAEIEEAKSLTKKNELDEEQLETVAGGTEDSTAGTVNRYCPIWCKDRTTHRNACYFPVLWCDHYRYSFNREDTQYRYYDVSCVKCAYPPYIHKELREF